MINKLIELFIISLTLRIWQVEPLDMLRLPCKHLHIEFRRVKLLLKKNEYGRIRAISALFIKLFILMFYNLRESHRLINPEFHKVVHV